MDTVAKKLFTYLANAICYLEEHGENDTYIMNYLGISFAELSAVKENDFDRFTTIITSQED
jgi:hypothetical protein